MFEKIRSEFKDKKIGISTEHISFRSDACHVYGFYHPYHQHFDKYNSWCKDFHLTYNYDNQLTKIDNARKHKTYFWCDISDFQEVLLRDEDEWDLSLRTGSFFDDYLREQHTIFLKQKKEYSDLELAIKFMFSFREYALNNLTRKDAQFTGLYIDSNPPIRELKRKRDLFLRYIKQNNPYDILENASNLLETL
jgi:hypothetical protein